MKHIHTHFKLLLLFGVFAVFSGCEKDEPYDPSESMDSYFEGKVNGQEFEPDGHWGCSWMTGAYHPNGSLDFDEGYFHVSIRNCEEGQNIIIGTRSNLHEGVFSSCDDSVSPRGEFGDISTGIPGYAIMHANECQDIRLEITRVEETTTSHGYIEGTLDAIVRDPELDSTVVISDVKFGYKF